MLTKMYCRYPHCYVVAGPELGHGLLIGEVPDGAQQFLVHNHLVVWHREEGKILAGKGPLLLSVLSRGRLARLCPL
jgi:hypothetical protein